MYWAEKRAICTQKGFSLIELLIAISILAVGLLAAATMQSTAMNANTLANRNTMATTVAEQIMEDLMSADVRFGTPWYTTYTSAGTYVYNRFPPFNGSNAPVASYNLPGVGTFTAQYVVTLNTPAPNITQVEVRVSLNGNLVPLRLFGHKLIPPIS